MNIKIEKIDFSYKRNQIFNDFSTNLQFNKDCIVLMGHNGAGKTTLLNLICGILKSLHGTITVDRELDMAYLPFDNNIYANLTVLGNITFWYQIYNNKQLDLKNEFFNYLIDALKLRKLLHTKSISLSSGEEKKLAFLIILLSNAKLIILDEPFNGIDPISILEITNLINTLRKKGTNFLISSHQLDILEKVATQYIIMKDYQILEMGNMNRVDTVSLYDKYEKIYKDDYYDEYI